jgi:DNA-binding transcriptional ArsR family regulator
MGESGKTARTVEAAILEVLREASGKMKAGDIISRLIEERDTTESTVRTKLSDMKKAGLISPAEYGYYKLDTDKGQPRSGDPSVEKKLIPPDAAIVIRHAETNEIWITIKIQCTVDVHDPINLTGGKPPTGGSDSIEGQVG